MRLSKLCILSQQVNHLLSEIPKNKIQRAQGYLSYWLIQYSLVSLMKNAFRGLGRWASQTLAKRKTQKV